MIKEIYLVPHSHTDIGYTHPQPIVLELHRRFLDQALDLAEATADRTDGSAFKWMVEVSGTALDWWRMARSAEKDRFIAAAKAGRVGVGGMRWNQAHLSDHHMLIEAMEPVRILREEGVPIQSAMNTDVNGVNWGVIEVMLDHGIENFSMAINEHFGHAVLPRPQAFNWLSPTGRNLLVYNGLIYGSSVSDWLGIPYDMDLTRRAVPRLAEKLEERGYPHDLLIMQATNVHYCDNNTPNPDLPDHIRAFNAEGGPISLRIATLSEAFERLRQEDLSGIPTQSGDWPDWWTFGSGGTMRETAVTLAGERALRDAQQLTGWMPTRQRRSDELETQAAEDLALYVEHTYTADRAAQKPDSPDVDNQIHWKKAVAYEGLSLARMLRRDGLAAIAAKHAGKTRSMLAYNPLPYPVTRTLRVPNEAVCEHLFDTAEHVVHKQDVDFSDYPDDQMKIVAVELPALGYAVTPFADLKAPSGRINATAEALENDRVTIGFDPATGAVTSFKLDGEEFVADAPEFAFGVPVYERPDPQKRTTIYGPPTFGQLEKWDMYEAWHPDWKTVREVGDLIDTSFSTGDGYAEHKRTYIFACGDTADVTWRLSAGETALGVTVVVNKTRLPEPHSYYLPMPLQDEGSAVTTHYETAGAVVELDVEQLPGANRHFVPTQRFIRVETASRGLSVATPDLPLFQVGGLTFGRHKRGEVVRKGPVLYAWLNNNYWDTNFEVTQSGPLVTRFTLVPHKAEPLGASVEKVLPYVSEPQIHVLNASGAASGQLLDISANDLILTGAKRDGERMTLYVLNTADEPRTLTLGPGSVKAKEAVRIALDGKALDTLSVDAGRVALDVPPRGWTGVALTLES